MAAIKRSYCGDVGCPGARSCRACRAEYQRLYRGSRHKREGAGEASPKDNAEMPLEGVPAQRCPVAVCRRPLPCPIHG